MPKYRESQTAAQQWQRAGEIRISYPHAGNPKVTFYEEIASQIGDGPPVMREVGSLEITINAQKLAEAIPLRDPVTGDLTGGETSYAAIAQGIFSAYYHEGKARDAR